MSPRSSGRYCAISIFGKRAVNEVNHEVANLAFHNRVPSGVSIPAGLKRLLGLNLNFCMTPKPLTRVNLSTTLEEFVRSYRIKYQFRDSSGSKKNFNAKLYIPNKSWQPKPACETAEQIFYQIKCNLAAYLPPRTNTRNLNVAQQRTLEDLLSRKDLLVVQADKNLGPVLFLKSNYLDMCLQFLLNTKNGEEHTYCTIDSSIKCLEIKMRTTAEDFYEEVKKLRASRDNAVIVTALEKKSLNVFYGTAKIHKPGLKPRPIVSNATGILGGLSRWLDYHLQQYLPKLKTFIRDSDALIDRLKVLERDSSHRVFTFDVVSMYTSIDTKRALHIIGRFLPNNKFNRMLLKGLEVIMQNNFFTFDGKIWHQLNGTAMGTSVAPAYAILFLGAAEERLYAQFSEHMVCNARFIDDGFMIWKDNGNPYSFRKYIAMLTRESGLKFTFEEATSEAVILDLVVFWDEKTYLTRTYQKDLNLYLYVPKRSAHPPGIIKSIVYGRVLKFAKQNSRQQDFLYFCQRLLHQLQARGYDGRTLLPLFKTAMDMTRGLISRSEPVPFKNQLFLKLPFDPNGPRRNVLAQLFEFDELQPLLDDLDIQKVTICYKKPRNLKALVCPTRLTSNPMGREIQSLTEVE